MDFMPNRIGAMIAFTLALVAQDHAMAQSPETSGLKLEAKIPLGNVSGRIDHMAIDLARQRLFVAELGNNSVGIVDLNGHNVIRTLDGLKEPQGVAYLAPMDTVYVANGGDGSVRLFRGADFAAAGRIELGDDADNVRIDSMARRVYVGYRDGAIAIIDPGSARKIAEIRLKGHPESFQLDPAGDHIFANVPDAAQVAVVSRRAQQQVATWPTTELRANFPLALDTENGRALVIFRHPAQLAAFDVRTGQRVGTGDVCGDADDVFVDSKRHRVYVICGEGYADSLDSSGITYARQGRIATSRGSRTGLFIPELDRLVIAIRSSGAEPAAVWILRPGP